MTGYDEPWSNSSSLHEPQTTILSTLPPFTGSLDFHLLGEAGDIARRLLDLPNGLHFRKLALTWDDATDLWWITELVTRCFHTLECLEITHTFRRTFIHTNARIDNLASLPVELEPGSFDLSTTTKLHDLVFRLESLRAEWITVAPEHRDLQRISIHIPYNLTLFGQIVGQFLGEAICRGWFDLDSLLVQFWESRSIRPRVGCETPGQKWKNTEYCIGCLLPEITKRGIFDPFYQTL